MTLRTACALACVASCVLEKDGGAAAFIALEGHVLAEHERAMQLAARMRKCDPRSSGPWACSYRGEKR